MFKALTIVCLALGALWGMSFDAPATSSPLVTAKGGYPTVSMAQVFSHAP